MVVNFRSSYRKNVYPKIFYLFVLRYLQTEIMYGNILQSMALFTRYLKLIFVLS